MPVYQYNKLKLLWSNTTALLWILPSWRLECSVLHIFQNYSSVTIFFLLIKRSKLDLLTRDYGEILSYSLQGACKESYWLTAGLPAYCLLCDSGWTTSVVECRGVRFRFHMGRGKHILSSVLPQEKLECRTLLTIPACWWFWLIFMRQFVPFPQQQRKIFIMPGDRWK